MVVMFVVNVFVVFVIVEMYRLDLSVKVNINLILNIF